MKTKLYPFATGILVGLALVFVWALILVLVKEPARSALGTMYSVICVAVVAKLLFVRVGLE